MNFEDETKAHRGMKRKVEKKIARGRDGSSARRLKQDLMVLKLMNGKNERRVACEMPCL